MNIPNLLSLLRIFFIPLLVVVLLTPFRGQELAGLAIFLLATVTDSLDGFWARRRKQITVLGQLLDPVADKLLTASAFICFVERGDVTSWMVVIIVGREIAVTGFRAVASSKGITIQASALGKIKMFLETVTICLLIGGGKYLGKFYFLTRIGLWLVIVAAVVSAAEYIIKFGPRILSDKS
ncbi:MAG: CDP-diacylglycerol--glycerol-3-phosphate 3-phosphatidyltransferase [Candidatus Aminicenantales bacterium]